MEHGHTVAISSPEITMREFIDGSGPDMRQIANDALVKTGVRWMLDRRNDELWLATNDEEFGEPETSLPE